MRNAFHVRGDQNQLLKTSQSDSLPDAIPLCVSLVCSSKTLLVFHFIFLSFQLSNSGSLQIRLSAVKQSAAAVLESRNKAFKVKCVSTYLKSLCSLSTYYAAGRVQLNLTLRFSDYITLKNKKKKRKEYGNTQ